MVWILVSCAVVYVISLIVTYIRICKDYSVGGVFETLKPDLSDFVYTVMPVFNTIAAVCILLVRIENNLNFDWFFKIKK